DPSGSGAYQEGDDVGDVFRLTEAFQWRHLGEGLDLLFAFAVQEQFSGDRAGSDRIDGDVAPAQFLGKHLREGFHRRFAGDVYRVARQVHGHGAAGEVDDPPAGVQAGRGFAQGVEGAAGIDGEGLLEQFVAVLGQWQNVEDSGVVHQYVDLAQLRFGLI